MMGYINIFRNTLVRLFNNIKWQAYQNRLRRQLLGKRVKTRHGLTGTVDRVGGVFKDCVHLNLDDEIIKNDPFINYKLAWENPENLTELSKETRGDRE